MKDVFKDIDAILAGAVEEKTFSLEAVERIKKMRDEYAAMTTSLATCEENLKTSQAALTSAQIENSAFKQREMDLVSREEKVAEKEKKQELNEAELKHAKERHTDVLSMFSIVFKNPAVRETVYRNTSTPIAQNGYATTVNGTENETRQTEKE